MEEKKTTYEALCLLPKTVEWWARDAMTEDGQTYAKAATSLDFSLGGSDKEFADYGKLPMIGHPRSVKTLFREKKRRNTTLWQKECRQALILIHKACKAGSGNTTSAFHSRLIEAGRDNVLGEALGISEGQLV